MRKFWYPAATVPDCNDDSYDDVDHGNDDVDIQWWVIDDDNDDVDDNDGWLSHHQGLDDDDDSLIQDINITQKNYGLYFFVAKSLHFFHSKFRWA